MAKVQNTDNTKCWLGCAAMKLSFIARRNAKWYSCSGRHLDVFLTKLNILLPYDTAIMLLGIYPKKLKNYVHTKTCTCMFFHNYQNLEAIKMYFSK